MDASSDFLDLVDGQVHFAAYSGRPWQQGEYANQTRLWIALPVLSANTMK